MLKGPENEETRLFCHIFIVEGISIERGAPPVALMIVTLMLFVILRF